jgi:acetylornithine deacetylase
MELRVGFYPGVTAAAARAAVEDCLRRTAAANRQLKEVQYRVRYAGFQSEGFVANRSAPMMTALAFAHERVLGAPPEWYASTATTDARTFELYGSIPATCYGPEAANIHGIDESVSLASTVEVTKVLALFLARWCGLEKA